MASIEDLRAKRERKRKAARVHARKRKKLRNRAKHHGIVAARRRREARKLGEKIRQKKRRQGPDRACEWALQQCRDGIKESPAGSNRGPRITDWQRHYGDWLVGQPWCGVFVGQALERAGVKGITSRVAAVTFIKDDAAAGRNGFAKLVPASQAQPGDAVILYGHNVHVELVIENRGSFLVCAGGNTSPGNSGSQANGGGCYVRHRPMSIVHAVARPNWS